MSHSWGKCVIIILAGMAVFFNVAGYLIEERQRWPIINASWTAHSSLEKDNSLNHCCFSHEMGCMEYI